MKFLASMFLVLFLVLLSHFVFGLDENNPVREISIIASEDGYYPKNIIAFRGEKVRLFLTGTMSEPSCLIMPEKSLFLSAKKGSISEKEVVFEESGSYKFYCPSGQIEGRLVVLDRSNSLNRETASSQGLVNKKISKKAQGGQQ